MDKANELIVALLALIFAIIGIFPFPFCREVTSQICKTWCKSCCGTREMHSPYHEKFKRLIDEEEKSVPLLDLDTDQSDSKL